jgi:thioredoxin-related protein
MRSLLHILILLFLPTAMLAQAPDSLTVNWHTWGEAMSLRENAMRKLYVFVYKDDCPHSAKMMTTTFTDSSVVNQLNNDYYAVKLNVETKDTILYQGLKLVSEKSGDFWFHQLAVSLLNGDMSFPGIVIIDEEMKRVNLMKGYKNRTVMANTLMFFTDDGHKNNQAQQFGFGYNCQNPYHRHGQTSFGPTLGPR